MARPGPLSSPCGNGPPRAVELPASVQPELPCPDGWPPSNQNPPNLPFTRGGEGDFHLPVEPVAGR